MPRFGVTGFVATIVTSAPSVYPAALANLRRAPHPGEARVLGTHVEGPFISPRQHGTHDPAFLRLPDRVEAEGWLEAGDIRWLTLAPELPGALDLARFLVDRGVRVSIGHTDATWAEAAAAVDAGATMATHVFNAMRPLHHRDPGVVGLVLASSLTAGFIADGQHLAFDTIRLLARVKAPDELVLVTDALAGLGMPPGRYVLAGRDYRSDGTVGRLPDGTLSGSLLPLNLALRNLVQEAGLEPALAIRFATLNAGPGHRPCRRHRPHRGRPAGGHRRARRRLVGRGDADRRRRGVRREAPLPSRRRWLRGVPPELPAHPS